MIGKSQSGLGEMVKTIKICKAEPLHNKKPEPVVIIIDSQIPDFGILFPDAKGEEWYKQVRAWYQTEAETIAKALYESLPQGTFDRLWIELAKIKTSLYRGITD